MRRNENLREFAFKVLPEPTVIRYGGGDDQDLKGLWPRTRGVTEPS